MYIAIEGVIGVGKTTLVRMLQQRFEADVCLEVFEENPFLAKFYEDRERFAFQTQMFFLLSRYHQQRREIPERLKRNEALISDYTFDKDAIFARINLAGDELEMYFSIHEALAEKIPVPDLTLYLQADTRVLMDRIAKRDRPYERNMDQGYIGLLNDTYTAYFQKKQAKGNVLTIETNDLDFVRFPKDLDYIENRIRQALELAPFQPELPLNQS
jgi:deoxyguanosine kinase